VNVEASFVYNGDFEANGGSLDGWTVFTTPTGTNGMGMPRVVRFDTCMPGDYSYAAKFNVGTTQYPNPGGGGIKQTVNLAAGEYQLKVCTAVLDETGRALEGGLFELLFDGVVVDSHNYGFVLAGTTYRALLAANVVAPVDGEHEVQIRITRPYLSSCCGPRQYLDCVELVPEPTTVAILSLGGLALLRKERRVA
jgi:hypothetical protein